MSLPTNHRGHEYPTRCVPEYNHLDPAPPVAALMDYEPDRDYEAAWIARGYAAHEEEHGERHRDDPRGPGTDESPSAIAVMVAAARLAREARARRLADRLVREALVLMSHVHVMSHTHAIDVLMLIGGCSKTAAYEAFKALGTLGYVEQISLTTLCCSRAPGLQTVLAVTGKFNDHAADDGVPALRDPAPVTSRTEGARVVEQLVLTTRLLERVVDGWVVSHGDAALDALVSARLRAPRSHRYRNLEPSDRARMGRLAPGQGLTVLTPPALGPGEPHPHSRVLLGGSWTPTRTCTDALWRAIAIARPVDVDAWHRSAGYVARLRTITTRILRGPDEPSHLDIHRGRRGPEWQTFWNQARWTLAIGGPIVGRPTIRERVVTWWAAIPRDGASS